MDGTAEWSHSGNRGRCVGQASGSYSLKDEGTSISTGQMQLDQYGLTFANGQVDFTGGRGYHVVGSTKAAAEAIVNYVCPDGHVSKELLLNTAWIDRDSFDWAQVAPDGQTIKGSYTITTTDAMKSTIRINGRPCFITDSLSHRVIHANKRRA